MATQETREQRTQLAMDRIDWQHYIRVNVGEMLQPGDLFFNPQSAQWVAVKFFDDPLAPWADSVIRPTTEHSKHLND
tara:strand:+ start:423 stop:653 length:231 start_codon:yes stop_codon:yes gene_type:complete